MKEFFKQNLSLVLAFSLPIILIIIVAASTYLPSLYLSTNYNFIYSVCTDGTNYNHYYCNKYLKNRLEVVNGKLVVQDINPTLDSDNDGIPDINESYKERIFLHDTAKNESREITIEEARELSLNNLLTSPDGISVSSDYSNGADFLFLFDGGSSYGYYLMKGNNRSKLNLINSEDRYYYQDNFQFIGWVLPGRN